jgi:hypothetical protein
MSSARSEVGEATIGSAQALTGWLRLELGLLALQFVLGMWLNFFGTFPSGVTTLAGVYADVGNPELLAHLVVAFLLVGASLIVAVLAQGRGLPRALRLLGVADLVAVLAAAIFGYEFVASAFTDDRMSFGMAMAFVVAVYLTFTAHGMAAPLGQRRSGSPRAEGSGTA